MKAKAFSKMIKDDLTDEIEVQLNSFVRSVISDLTSDGEKRGVSPVLTGFFASSWKAGLTRPSHNEPIQGKWAKLKKVKVRRGDVVTTELAPGVKPIIEQRHAVPRDFKIDKAVFIGNTAEFVDGTGTGDIGIQLNPIGLAISTRNAIGEKRSH